METTSSFLATKTRIRGPTPRKERAASNSSSDSTNHQNGIISFLLQAILFSKIEIFTKFKIISMVIPFFLWQAIYFSVTSLCFFSNSLYASLFSYDRSFILRSSFILEGYDFFFENLNFEFIVSFLIFNFVLYLLLEYFVRTVIMSQYG